MHTIRLAVPAILLAILAGGLLTAPSAVAAPRPARQFTLINATFDSITALAMAPAGGDGFRDIALDAPLQGGLNAMTFDVPGGGCQRDLRVTFRNGRREFLPRIDVCRSSGLRLTPHGSRREPSRP